MRLKKISVEFEIADVQQILAIALDDNAEEALVLCVKIFPKKSKRRFSAIECRFSRSVTAPVKENSSSE